MKTHSRTLIFSLIIVLIGIVLMLLIIPIWLLSDKYPKGSCQIDMSYSEGIEKHYVTEQSIKLAVDCKPLLELPLSSCVSSITVNLNSYPITDFILGRDRGFTVDYTFDTDMLHDEVAELYIEGSDSQIVLDETGYHLIPEIVGREFDIDAVVELIVQHKEFIQPVDFKSLLFSDVITSDDLEEDFSNVSWMNDWCVSYTNDYRIDFEYLYNNILTASEPSWEAAIKLLEKSFTTKGSGTSFVNHSGETVTVNNKTFGYTVDVEKELEFLKKALEERKSYSDRTPTRRGYGDITDTYIEISKDEQHLWHYVDGEVCCETDIVTGNKSNHNTPSGVYYISEKIDGKYLRGADYVTWVNKWMRLTNSGIGLHDAYWRSKFGGEIYTYDGSHGCINLPKSFAYTLYSEVSVGDRVVIY